MASLHVSVNGLTRRAMLKTTAAGVLAYMVPEELLAAAGAARIGIAVQLYSVRDVCAKDFDAALDEVAKMGFAGVEFAGYYNYAGKGKELRKRLDDLMLNVAGTHIATSNIQGDNIKGTVDFHQAIGCKYLVVPSDRNFADPEKSKELAETFNKAAEILKPLGMACGYHNHTAEFKTSGDKTYWELFAERTTKDVVLQLDCGWAAAAKQNPVDWIKKYPGRTKTAHFKPTVVGEDPGKKAILGEDSVDWKAVTAACYQAGGTEWFIIEQETYPDGKSSMECTELSLAGLRKILAGTGK